MRAFVKLKHGACRGAGGVEGDVEFIERAAVGLRLLDHRLLAVARGAEEGRARVRLADLGRGRAEHDDAAAVVDLELRPPEFLDLALQRATKLVAAGAGEHLCRRPALDQFSPRRRRLLGDGQVDDLGAAFREIDVDPLDQALAAESDQKQECREGRHRRRQAPTPEMPAQRVRSLEGGLAALGHGKTPEKCGAGTLAANLADIIRLSTDLNQVAVPIERLCAGVGSSMALQASPTGGAPRERDAFGPENC
jgi:hypothetical protein